MTRGLKPESCRDCSAEARSRLVTSGTVDVFGPFDTVTLTVAPFPADWPADGSWLITLFAGSFESTNVGLTLKPSARSTDVAVASGWPTTVGTETGVGPFDTL